jgi:two-component system, LytTR family, response regulator
MKARTLIVDDEQLARERLQQLLANRPEIELLGACADGREAVAAINREAPDLIFLDVQMPELDGFAVIEAADIEPMPVIVFVTAYDKFALQAFEVQAVDYLLKPFDRERFESALQRALERVKQRTELNAGEIPTAELAEPAAPSKPLERLAIKSNGRILVVKTAEIAWIQSAHNYVEIHQDNQKAHLLRENIGALEARLDPDKFVRISRSVIISIDRVKELEPLFYGEYSVTLQNGQRLTLSRRYRHKLPLLGLSK